MTLLVHFTVGSSGSICLQGHQPVVSLYTYTYSTDTYTHYEHLSINTKILHSLYCQLSPQYLDFIPSVHFKPMSSAARTSPSRMPRRPHRGWDELPRGFSHQTTHCGGHNSRPRPRPGPRPRPRPRPNSKQMPKPKPNISPIPRLRSRPRPRSRKRPHSTRTVTIKKYQKKTAH